MKAKEFDDHCGECPLIDFCGEPYEDVYFCHDPIYMEMDHLEIIRNAERTE